MKRTTLALAVAAALLVASPSFAAPPGATVTQSQAGSVLRWTAAFPHAVALLRVSGPDGVVEQKFGPEPVQFAANPSTLAAGSYVVEVTFVSQAPAARSEARTPPQVAQTTANFLVQGGMLYTATMSPAPTESGSKRTTVSGSTVVDRADAVGSGARAKSSERAKDAVVADDQIVQGSLCVGLDCVNNESFGFDTIRLKENNTRIKFDDTSTGIGFPSTDWQLTANDSASGGANQFSIEDVTAGTVPFKVIGAAPTNSLFVDAAGRVGLGTSTPVMKLHGTNGNTPGLRLEQTNGNGFVAQTWDVAGNEANFFVRDLTSGSKLPFRIRPGAPTSSIDVSAVGNVGIGTAFPAQPLHVRRDDGRAQSLVEEASSTTATRTLASFVNNGDVKLSFSTTAVPVTTWETIAGNGGYSVALAGAATPQMTLAANGNLNIGGALTQASSVTLKENIVPVSSEQLLLAVQSLPIYTWNYLTAPKSEQHLGPTAEDFHRIFSLGSNPKAIAPGDLAGVALGAIQALGTALAEKDRELTALRERMATLEAIVTGNRK